jgi:hypothetical protein
VTVRAVRGYSGQGAYRELAEGLAKNTEAIYSENSRASDPIVVAKAIRKGGQSARPKPRYPVGYMARPLLALNTLLPDRAFDRIATSQTSRR